MSSATTNSSGASLKSNLKQALGLSLYGMHMDSKLPMMGFDNELSSMVFFTRPQLNLCSENIIQVREMANLLTNNSTSIGAWVRNTLDPRLGHPSFANILGGGPCPLVNNSYGFIPALTNLCVKTSGWPVRAVSTYVSPPGKYREVYMQVDGRSRLEGPVTITAEFARIPGDPITSLFETWGVYPEYVFEGLLDPYIDLILNREIDYNIRMFVFSFDASGIKIVRSGSTLPGIVMISGDGAPFDFTRDKTEYTQNPTVSFPMKFPAVVQNDPAILLDFNQITEIFKPKMKTREGMIKVPFVYRGYFKGYLYPYIDLATSKLETWVEAKIFNTIANRMLEQRIVRTTEEITNG